MLHTGGGGIELGERTFNPQNNQCREYRSPEPFRLKIPKSLEPKAWRTVLPSSSRHACHASPCLFLQLSQVFIACVEAQKKKNAHWEGPSSSCLAAGEFGCTPGVRRFYLQRVEPMAAFPGSQWGLPQPCPQTLAAMVSFGHRRAQGRRAAGVELEPS